MSVESGAEGTSNPINIQDVVSNPEVQNYFQKMLDEHVAGLKNKNSELLQKNKEITEKFKQFESLGDPGALKNLVDRMKNDEDTRLLAEGKIDEVVSRRVEVMRNDFAAQIEARENKIKEYEGLVKQKDDHLASLVIDGQIREAYVSLDFEPAAMDDVIRLGRTIFIMDENGNAVPRDNTGKLIFGKDGRAPLTAKEWVEALVEKKPYLRRTPKGGGSKSTSAGNGMDPSKMSSTQKIAAGLEAMGIGRK